MEWKQALYRYVDAHNKMMAEYNADAASESVRDSSYLDKQQVRLERMKDQIKQRGGRSLRHETRVKLRHVKQGYGVIAAELEFRRRWIYTIAKKEYTQETREREIVTLREFKGSWILTSVQPIQHEGERSRQEFHVQHHSLSKDYMDATVYPSEPLLNKQINTIGTPFARTVRYDRKEAARYADLWWDQTNPAYLTFEVDCTNYVSQCLFAGGAPMNYTGKRESGWWYSGMEGSRELWSYSWAVAHALQSYLPRGRRYLGGTEVNSAGELLPGDVICYDWDGNGRFQHNTIVTAKDKNGMPLVNAHTVSSYHRYWDYRDSYAWTKQTRYVFIHIHDNFNE